MKKLIAILTILISISYYAEAKVVKTVTTIKRAKRITKKKVVKTYKKQYKSVKRVKRVFKRATKKPKIIKKVKIKRVKPKKVKTKRTKVKKSKKPICKRHRLSIYAGYGPAEIESNISDYKAVISQENKELFGAGYNYRLNKTLDVGGGFLTNKTYFMNIGFSF